MSDVAMLTRLNPEADKAILPRNGANIRSKAREIEKAEVQRARLRNRCPAVLWTSDHESGLGRSMASKKGLAVEIGVRIVLQRAIWQ
jgi:hypothetical protein